MNNVIVRSLVLLVVSTAIVLVSAFVAPPASPSTMATSTESGETAGNAMSGMSGMNMTVDSEAAFILSMIPHHQEAVESARAVLETTERPEVRELAQNVIATQTEELATLEGWRDQWYPDATEAAYTPMMADPTGLTDRAFLEGMVEHHQGAIDMARSYLGANYEKRGDVAQMAEVIVNAQSGEITQMQEWLNEWFGKVGTDSGTH